MFLVDDILLAPIKGVFWICKELYSEAEKELDAEEGSITTQLSELYMMLETGKITDAEFDAQEKALLDRLEVLEARHVADDTAKDDQTEE